MSKTKEISREVFSTAEAALRLGVPHWQVRRVYERHFLPDPPRVGRQRALCESDLPDIRAAMVKAGYLKE